MLAQTGLISMIGKIPVAPVDGADATSRASKRRNLQRCKRSLYDSPRGLAFISSG